MKLNSTPPMRNAPAQQFTRANRAWAVDYAILDLAERPFVMLVIDVHTRRPLMATVTPTIPEDIAAALERSFHWPSLPEEIWIDRAFERNAALRPWAHEHRISIIYVPVLMPQMKSLSERPLRDLSAFLRDKRFPTLMELGHDIERWRQHYAAARRPFPAITNSNQ